MSFGRTIPWNILTCIIPLCSPVTWTWLVVFPGKGGGERLVTEVELRGRGLLRCCCVPWQRTGQKVSHLGQSEAIHSGSTNCRWGSPRWLSEQCMFFKILPTKLVNSDSTKRTQISFHHASYYLFSLTNSLVFCFLFAPDLLPSLWKILLANSGTALLHLHFLHP